MTNEVVCGGLRGLWALYGFECDIIFCDTIYIGFFFFFFTIIIIIIIAVAICWGRNYFKDYVTSQANNQLRDYADERWIVSVMTLWKSKRSAVARWNPKSFTERSSRPPNVYWPLVVLRFGLKFGSWRTNCNFNRFFFLSESTGDAGGISFFGKFFLT